MAAESIESPPVEILMEPENHQESFFSSRTLTSLAEISRSPGHNLLLQLWQRDEHLSGYRVAVRELQLENFKREMRLFGVQRVKKLLKTDKGSDRALTMCVQELRLKGASFDLSMEPLNVSSMKSTSVAIQLRLLRWCSRNLITLCLAGVSVILIPASRLLLCS
ncbi:uncharacterized protein LOC120262263 isoform X2 [Dioscorea cayenensis subsp. rotundata]|uniref:Uncharacterized protein LOC120262263 isoform X2 n=1 Tax=Dioscorea cayennensis subsp. rotundata TaxID=55577 RepID=A0AB40BI45_DIOCR|nr:uncharacterized protein LOC120262263 isoform X2 [Dioscorea cayenensis subsp. rotundata]